MRDARQQIEELKSAVRALEAKVRVTNKRLAGVMTTPPFQTVLVVADEKIEPDETGKCFIMKRLSRDTYNNGFRKLDKRESTSFQVYNHRKTPIFEGEEFHIARDTTGGYYRVRDREHYTSFFLTPENGIPAAEQQFLASKASCERRHVLWAANGESSGVIRVLEDLDGMPVFEDVWNHTSFLADTVPLPGRNVSAGLRFDF